MRRRPIDPNHTNKRNILRVIGPAVLVLGIALTAISFTTVVMGDPFAHPGRAGLAFAGMPLMFVGLVLSGMGYAGAVARYHAGEYAPVAEDTFNHVAEGTKDGVRTLASAIGEGLRGEAEGNESICPACGAGNEAGSKFCDQCGNALPREATCPDCGEANDPDARFCDNCGKPIDSAR